MTPVRDRSAFATVVLCATVLFAGCSSTPHTRVSAHAGGPPAGSAQPDATGPPTTTTAAQGASATAGTAYANPGRIVYPNATTTTIPRTTTTPPPSSGDTVTVTQDDNGKTFTLRRDQHLVVTLDDPSWQWSAPDTDNASVLARTAVSANPSSTHVTAAFEPKSAGQAHVSASKDAPCRAAQPPCMVPTMLWQITVNVV